MNNNFMESLRQESFNGDYNDSITENGAHGYRTTGKALLDLNFKIPSLRRSEYDTINEEFISSYDSLYSIPWAFYVGDIRGGLGERHIFKSILYTLVAKYMVTSINEDKDKYLEFLKKLVMLIPEYSRWDHFIDLAYLGNDFSQYIIEELTNQLGCDINNSLENKQVSLLAKWMPSINSKNKKVRSKALYLMNNMSIFNSEKEYRSCLSHLRRHLNVTETYMASNRFSEIDYEAVPSKANLIYKDAFMRHDSERRQEYLNKLSNGEAKINSSVLYPYEIVNKMRDNRGSSFYIKYSSEVDETLEQLWKNLPDYVNGRGDTLVVSDGSGSMTSRISDKTPTRIIDVALSIAIYFSERNNGQFRDKFITFSSNPQFVDLSNCDSLCSKLITASKYTEVADTNIEKTFKLILDTAVKNHYTQEDIPKNILIISDMEFNSCTDDRIDIKLFDHINNQYNAAGYKMPRLIFWNVGSRTNTIPVKENDLGVALVSGFSTTIFDMVLNDELDPYKILTDKLNSERYKPVMDLVKEYQEVLQKI